MTKKKVSKAKRLIEELSDFSRNEIVAVITWLNNKTDYQIATYGSKDQLLHGLCVADAETLEEAMDAMLPEGESEEEADGEAEASDEDECDECAEED